MTYTLCVSLALLGGFGKCRPVYNPCYTPCPVVYSVPCYQPVVVACQPEEMADPVSDVEEEAEPASVESELAEIMAATDRPESLTPEIGLAELGEAVAFDDATPVGFGGGIAMGFTPGAGSLGGGLGGLAFGNGQGRPGFGVGGGGGFGGGGAQGRQDIDVGDGDRGAQDQIQGLVVNVNSLLNNVNNLSQSQQQQQQQKQHQHQHQHQHHHHGHKGGGHGEEVPLPATAWMGLFGVAAAIVAKRRGMIG